jgi:hypothetical protein
MYRHPRYSSIVTDVFIRTLRGLEGASTWMAFAEMTSGSLKVMKLTKVLQLGLSNMVLGVLFVLLVVGGALTITYWRPDLGHNAKSTTCLSNLCTLHSSFMAYHHKYKQFPPAFVPAPDGKRVHSWRVLLLEFLSPELYAQYDFREPWDGPSNKKLSNQMPVWYKCPNSRDDSGTSRTSYVVLVGKSTLFPGHKCSRLADVKDRFAETILLVEAHGINVHWMEPRDWEVDDVDLAVGEAHEMKLSSYDRPGPAICCLDMGYFRLKRAAPVEQLKAMSTIAGGETVDLASVRAE